MKKEKKLNSGYSRAWSGEVWARGGVEGGAPDRSSSQAERERERAGGWSAQAFKGGGAATAAAEEELALLLARLLLGGGLGRGGHLLGGLPVLLCSWARALGVVHMLRRRARVGLPVGVVVLLLNTHKHTHRQLQLLEYLYTTDTPQKTLYSTFIYNLHTIIMYYICTT